MSDDLKRIVTRLPDDDDGGYIKFPAYLVRDNLALAIFDEHLEVHIVASTDDPNEFDLLRASNPIFYVGDDFETVLNDISKMTLVEFVRKYEHSEFLEE